MRNYPASLMIALAVVLAFTFPPIGGIVKDGHGSVGRDSPDRIMAARPEMIPTNNFRPKVLPA
jgi:hypothetical protein